MYREDGFYLIVRVCDWCGAPMVGHKPDLGPWRQCSMREMIDNPFSRFNRLDPRRRAA